MDIVGALREETERVAALLANVNDADWEKPTRCPPMRLHELVAHTLRGGLRIKEMLQSGFIDAPPEADGATYFQYDPAVVGPDVVERAFAAAKEFDAPTLASRWKSEWQAALSVAAEEIAAGDRVYRTVFGELMKFSEYLRTRAVEVVIHHMDMRDALGLQPEPAPAGLDAACGVLAQMLGTDPRSLGMDGVRFALIGTGRAPVNDDVRTLLGPLADMLPVLS